MVLHRGIQAGRVRKVGFEHDVIGAQALDRVGHIRLEPVILQKDTKIENLLKFYMGKNTPDRQEFIIDNLRVELDAVEGRDEIEEEMKGQEAEAEMVEA